MLKKVISLLLCLPLVACCGAPVSATNTTAQLYNVYGNGMLFQQNEKAILSGTAKSGDSITLLLLDKENKLVAHSDATAVDGTFTISFNAPAGSFSEYTIILKCNSVEFARLTDVVFGELWLASGQSNMMYPLGQSKVGSKMMEDGEKLSKWIRVLTEPAYPQYNGQDSLSLVPVDPQPDIIDAKWIDGESDLIYGMSAVAAFFAIDMAESLNVPIGILNSSLGGSSVASWISREAIDKCPKVKSMLSNRGLYIEKDKWIESEQNIYHDMGANFNLRTNALKNFRPQGIIWYQGESDLMNGYIPEEYSAQLELLQSSYTEHFNYTKGLLPLIYTHLAPYYYSETGYKLLDWNINYTEFQHEAPESRAVVTNYDVPLTYISELGFIHPENKQEIGQRMATAAKSLVYNNESPYTAAYPISTEVADSSIFITFNNVGDTLKVKGNSLYGFAICGSDGIYLKADAEIISNNTIRVYCEDVKNPVSVTYAYCLGNYKANLYSSCKDELFMPVSPFVVGSVEKPHYWADKNWADCEDFSLYHNYLDEISGTYRAWEVTNAKISINTENAFNGDNGLGIVSQKQTFSVAPLMTYRDGVKLNAFQEADSDYSDYGTMSFYIRNNGKSDVTLDSVTFCENAINCYNPVNNISSKTQTTIPADSQWHKITLDLNTLYVADYNSQETFSNNVLSSVTGIKFNFSTNDEADISLDNIRFTAESEDEAETPIYSSIFEKLEAFFVMFFRVIFQILG